MRFFFSTCVCAHIFQMTSQAPNFPSEGPDSPNMCAQDEGVEPETQAMYVPIVPEAEAQRPEPKAFPCQAVDELKPPVAIGDLSLLPLTRNLSLDGETGNNATPTTGTIEHEHAQVRRRTSLQNDSKPPSICWTQMSPNERRFPWIKKKTCPLHTRLTCSVSSAGDSGSNSSKSKMRTDSAGTEDSSESSSREKAEMQTILENGTHRMRYHFSLRSGLPSCENVHTTAPNH